MVFIAAITLFFLLCVAGLIFILLELVSRAAILRGTKQYLQNIQ